MRKLRAFIRLSRPHFLLGGAMMYAVGAFSAGATNLPDYLWGQALVTATQITAHYVNEFADVKADRLVTNRTLFSGGSGVLTSGSLTRPVALVAALTTTAAALLLILFVEPLSTTAALLGFLALGVSWAYSLPPIRLLNTGFGELATSVVVSVFVPLVGATITGATPSRALVWFMAALLPVHMAMLLAFELPDLEADRRAHRKVLAVRLGESMTRRAMTSLLTLSVAAIGAAVLTGGLESPVLLPVAVAAVPGFVTLRAAKTTRYSLLTGSAAAMLVVLGVGLLVTVIL